MSRWARWLGLALGLTAWLAVPRLSHAYTGVEVDVQDGKTGYMDPWAYGYNLVIINNTDSNIAATCFHSKSDTPATFSCTYGTDDLSFCGGTCTTPGPTDSMTMLITFVGGSCDSAPVCSGPSGAPGSRPADISVDYIELPFSGLRDLGVRQTNSGPLAVSIASAGAAATDGASLARLLSALALASVVLVAVPRRRLRLAAAVGGTVLAVAAGVWVVDAGALAGMWVDDSLDPASPLVGGTFTEQIGAGQPNAVGNAVGVASRLDGGLQQWAIAGLTVASHTSHSGDLIGGPRQNGRLKVVLPFKTKDVTTYAGGTLTLHPGSAAAPYPWSDGGPVTVAVAEAVATTFTETDASGVPVVENGQTVRTTTLEITGTVDGRNVAMTLVRSGDAGVAAGTATDGLDLVLLEIH